MNNICNKIGNCKIYIYNFYKKNEKTIKYNK